MAGIVISIPEARIENPSFEVVGVTGDVKNQGLRDPISPELVIALRRDGAFDAALLVRTTGEPLATLAAIVLSPYKKAASDLRSSVK